LGNYSSINLRGLGENQTLILVDGRRLPPRPGVVSGFGQPDINGIPLAMIERIEVLPSTSSGIYGGGATGGMINIITRKDFSGVVLGFNYVNTFDTDAAKRRADLMATFNLRGGTTIFTLTASRSDSTDLLTQDRDFAVRSRQLLQKTSPSSILSSSTPILATRRMSATRPAQTSS